MPQAPAADASAKHDLLVQHVQSILTGSPYLESTHLRVEAEGGAIRIHGNVGTFFEKQMAQEAVRRIDGVDRVENLLEVNWR
ncbi:MAG: BON domain-containing protein [Planctomycetota bacterium]